MPPFHNASFIHKLKKWFLGLFKLTNSPVVNVYRGYGNKTHCIIFGHVLKLSPLPRRRYRQRPFINAIALLRLFMVKPWAGVTVRMEWEGKQYHYTTETDGFFRFEWQPEKTLEPGWHAINIELLDKTNQHVLAAGEGHVIIPFSNQFAFISDIDDTFLISHSSRLRKRLFVLLTENAHSRMPFEGVVNHYQLLAAAHAPDKTTNPFFYVSSSEWNLYNYIQEFSKKNGLPPGVYLLAQIKQFREVFKTGQNKHATKFMRISRILEAYPEQQFVLLGDDTQEDPAIYASISAHFKDRIFAVYIRRIEKRNSTAVAEKINQIKHAGIHCCYFTHSAEAVIHSKSIGLIQ